MSFDSLVNVKMSEVEIFDRAAVILQQNFNKYKDVNIVLPLNEMDGDKCSIQEVRLYSRHDAAQVEAKRHYMMGGPNYKAYLITTYYEDGYYILSLFGHFASRNGDIFYNKMILEDVVFWDVDQATIKSMPREIFEGAFGEIATAVAGKKSS